MRQFTVLLLLGLSAPAVAWQVADVEEAKVVQIYTQDELAELIKQNKHLQRVQDDECQLVQDIQARADVMKLPLYQHLFGDMLMFGVCINKDAKRGWDLLQAAALQGSPEALEQVGRYYLQGKIVQKDLTKAREFLYQAGAMGSLAAQLQLAELLLADVGSPRDYETVYRWLHHSVTSDQALHQRIEQALSGLASRMPASVLERAKRPL